MSCSVLSFVMAGWHVLFHRQGRTARTGTRSDANERHPHPLTRTTRHGPIKNKRFYGIWSVAVSVSVHRDSCTIHFYFLDFYRIRICISTNGISPDFFFPRKSGLTQESRCFCLLLTLFVNSPCLTILSCGVDWNCFAVSIPLSLLARCLTLSYRLKKSVVFVCFNLSVCYDHRLNACSPDSIPCGWLGSKYQLTN